MILYFEREFFISNGYFHTSNEVLDIQILDQKNTSESKNHAIDTNLFIIMIIQQHSLIQ